MKQLFACLLLLIVPSLLRAAKEGPISMYLPGSDTIYLVRISSFDKKTVNFSVTETLRGSPVKSISLVPGIINLKPDAEFLILSSNATRTGQWGDHIGSLMKGDLGWLDARVIRVGEAVYVEDCDGFENGKLKADMVLDGVPYSTLDHIKRLVKESAPKT